MCTQLLEGQGYAWTFDRLGDNRVEITEFFFAYLNSFQLMIGRCEIRCEILLFIGKRNP
jgi:hypothetical protein